MKRILLILLFVACAFLSMGQNNSRMKYIPWLEVEDITVNRYFIWHGDTIYFDNLVALSDSTIVFVTPKQLMDSIANLQGGHAPVTIDSLGNVAGLYLNGQILGLAKSGSVTNGFLSYDDWLRFYYKLDNVSHNETLLGSGTESNTLKVDTTKIATRNWSNQQFIDFDDNWGGTWFGHDTTYFRTYSNLIGAPVISDTPYGSSWNGNMDGATKNTIWDILQTLGGLGTDLSLTRDANQAIIYSDTGNDVIVPAVTPTLAGLMTASDKTKLNAATKLDSIYTEPDAVFPIEYLKYSVNSVTYDITEIPKPNGLITGGYVTWITGLNFVISPAAYYITGELFITGTESVTLSASDATYSRIDLIVVDTINHVSVIEGVPGENPQKPTPDPVSQIEITQILILANATEPGNPGQITDELIYDENVEWTGSANGVLVNFGSATTTYTGSISADVGTIGTNDFIDFAGTATRTVSDYENISLFVKLKQIISAQHTLNLRFYLNNDYASNEITLPINGKTTSWQAVTVPLTSIVFSKSTFNNISLRWNKSGSQSLVTGLYLDMIKLQAGIKQPVNTTTTKLVGDVSGLGIGTITTTVADDSHNHTIATLPTLVSSINGVTNDGGNIDLTAGGIVSITTNDITNTIQISAQPDTTNIPGLQQYIIDHAPQGVTGNEPEFEGWDKNASDDFNFEYDSLLHKPDLSIYQQKADTLTTDATRHWVNEQGFLKVEVDGDPDGEIQEIDVAQLTGTTLELSLSKTGQATVTVDLSPLQDGTGTDSQTATQVPIVDTGGYYDASNVEQALQELGYDISMAGDQWGTQTITHDITLQGGGTAPDPLKVDTTVIATRNYTELQINNITITSPVTSVNGQTGTVTITAPVTSVNGQTGAVTIATGGVNSVNGNTGTVTVVENANHTGEVTGSTTLTITDNVVDYGNVATTLKGAITDNDGAWDFAASGIVTATISSAITASFTNLQVNKSLKVKLIVSTGGSIAWPASCVVLKGSETIAAGSTYYIFLDCWASDLVLVSITKVAS